MDFKQYAVGSQNFMTLLHGIHFRLLVRILNNFKNVRLISLMRRSPFIKIWITLIVLLCGSHVVLHAQERLDQIRIDADGIMRWNKDGTEVTGFGVNYTVPFAHAYRSGKKLGVDLKQAIDQDVYHFARLGLDLFRIHVWDCEISDTLGNLIDNEHLELFDYLLLKLQERKINAVITPIAYWGNGWPDEDEATPGFSSKYGKAGCLTNPDAIKAQEKYLNQFVQHVNRYTGVAYKDDPRILAFEVCNEPHHRGTPDEVTSFVKKMKEAIQLSGCTKPVFYNVTHSIHLADAYFDAGIDGGTFQWYPTGLGFQKELGGNLLPNVDRYVIPFEDVLKKNGAARFVYEFDAADMGSSYMYPAMARSFRSAGMQLATHFSYDPTYLAPFNTEYNTHHMNLAYAPQKALSLMICAEIFRKIPLNSDYGVYPANTTFGPFRVSYEDNLAEMLTEEKFIYTNHTNTKIIQPEKINQIAGWGNSTLVEYDGTGAYFLDKLGEGIWRLELMPDAVIIDNLFGQNSLENTRAVINSQRRRMKISIPDFDYGYAIQSVDWRDSIIYREVENGVVEITPGVYLLMAPEYEQEEYVTLLSRTSLSIAEYYAPPATPKKTHVIDITQREFRISSINAKPESSSDPIILFHARLDSSRLNRQWVKGSKLIPPFSPDVLSNLYIKLDGLVETDEENPNAEPIGEYPMRHYFGDLIAGRRKELREKKYLVLAGHTPGGFNFPIQLSLIMKDGSAFGSVVELNSTDLVYKIPLDDLKKVKPVLLPRPYPTFLPYYSEAGNAVQLNLNQIESFQLSVGPGILKTDWEKTYELMIQGIWLE